DVERAELRVFHGLWEDEDLADPDLAALAALIGGAWDHPALLNPEVDVLLRAEAALGRGELERALGMVEGGGSARAGRVRIEALEGLGRFAEAIEAGKPVIALAGDRDMSAAEATDVALAMAAYIRLAGPAPDEGATYQQMLSLLTDAHQRRD